MKISKVIAWLKQPTVIPYFFYAGFMLIFISTIFFQFRGNRQELNFAAIILVNIFVSIGGITFINIWAKSNPTTEDGGTDYGLVFFSGAMACWSVNSLFQGLGAVYGFNDTVFYNLGNVLLSSLNSYFFLLSVPYFTYKDYFFNNAVIKSIGITQQNYVKRIGIWTGLVCVIVFLSGKMNIPGDVTVLKMLLHPAFLDALLLGVLTVYSLLLVFWKSFHERKYGWVSWISAVIMLFTLFVQFYRAYRAYAGAGPDITGTDLIFLVSYKILLVIIFFALAFSWSQEDSIRRIAGERKDMTHTIRDNLILLNTGFINLEEIKDARAKDVLLKYRIMIQSTLETLSHMHDNQHLDEKLTDYLDKRVEISKQALDLADQSTAKRTLTYQNHLTNDHYVNNGLKKDVGFFITELLLNAVKYCPPDNTNILLTLSFVQQHQTHFLLLRVMDNGPGLTESQAKSSQLHGLKRIFEKVAHHRGEIIFNSNNGADISILIPVQSNIDL